MLTDFTKARAQEWIDKAAALESEIMKVSYASVAKMARVESRERTIEVITECWNLSGQLWQRLRVLKSLVESQPETEF